MTSERTMTAVEREIATYDFGSIDRLVRRDWGFFPETKRNWAIEGWDGAVDCFRLDEDPYAPDVVHLVGIDVPLDPPIEEAIVEQNEKYTLIRNTSGGIEQFPKGKAKWDEVMPYFVRYPVESACDWHKRVKPRLDPDTPGRWKTFDADIREVERDVLSGRKLYQAMAIGGFMYLRAMMGPERLLLTFVDDPDLIHDMMQTWKHLVLTCLSRVQKHVPFFKFLIGEDISYKNGPLISPAMIREFLMPYYKTVISTLAGGQRGILHAEVDTDGNVDEVLPLYIESGFNTMRPFEVAAGSDVVSIGKAYPDLIISGGIDKRVLGAGTEDITREVKRIIPAMVERGGYIPTCDHSVPSTVSFANYLHYRKTVVSMDSRD